MNLTVNVQEGVMEVKRRLTINDIAARAGVSRQTISRVMNNKGDVSEATRNQVLRIIQELGYQPSLQARSMITRQTNTIALLLPDITNPFFPEIVQGVEETLRDHGQNVFLFMTNEDVEREITCIQMAQQYNVDGVILCSPRVDDANLRSLIPNMPPTVFLNRRLDIEGVYSVVIDAFQGSYDATKYLIQNGHRNIGIVVGPPRSLSGVQRLAGYKKAMADHGIPLKENLINEVQQFDELDVYKITKNFIKNQASAILTYNDPVAANMVQACLDLKLNVPDDISIMGFDGVSLSKQVTPRLTTMAVPLFEIGVMLADMLIKVVKGEELIQRHVDIYPVLRVAQSTKAINKLRT
ncbi:LacI family DNA-binding transcriptional regulator [Ammoniphilus sp. YIM 78166]|uniref:LacI family DNA-binding transcriptional regulator n=1 Tax=Ammoniphilus sp. YIM 78166 TaxID=1644106 RepID=UPI0014319AF7|nr:LacI family DNA-binding transcriptional regulator [Ammoniphilus sp. YIM 78166]